MGSTTNTPPGFAPTDFWPFTGEQMLDFRLSYLRDFVAINALQAVVVDEPGTLYVQGDEIEVTPDPADETGSSATGYVNVTDGVITSVKLTNLGSLYVSDPIISIATDAGVDAELTAVRATMKLSAYNKATGSQFFSDADINGFLNNLCVDRRSDLMAAYYDKLNEDISSPYPADADDAATSAEAVQLLIIYKFLRAECREAMLNDPGFVGSVPENNRDKFVEQWNGSIVTDRNWARQRTGGFGSVERRIK